MVTRPSGEARHINRWRGERPVWRHTLPLLLLGASVLGDGWAEEKTLAARWEFGTEEMTGLKSHGNIRRDLAGPSAPEFPDLDPDNTAVHLDGRGSYFSLADPGENSPYDFGNGDAITLEAWIKVDRIGKGQPMYVVGKGRTGSPEFPKNNQNWSLRIVGVGDGLAVLSIIFATTADSGAYQFHRWTSKETLDVELGWHHIAMAYHFGDPETMRGWIDGQPTTGIWDRGGKTTRPPVQDDDEVWIGSALGGNPTNSFRGYLDGVAIHRRLVPDAEMAQRFNRAGGPRTQEPMPEVMPVIDDVPPGRVLVTFSEGMPSPKRWLQQGEYWPEETARWMGDAFLLPRIPVRYDDSGSRSRWTDTMLLRMVADVDLPPGSSRILLRARGLSRLWVDGEVVARTEPAPRLKTDGQQAITPLATPPHPGLRVHGHRMQEVFGQVTLATDQATGPSRSRVVLEVLVGGAGFKMESGEINVAIETEEGDSYNVLVPALADSAPIPLTDQTVLPILTKMEESLQEYDDNTRRAMASSHGDFWKKRHDVAREWAQAHPGPAPPVGNSAATAHPIDAFILAKIDRLRAGASGANPEAARSFHETVLPVLRDACFRCHGEKEKGGIRLDSRASILQSGDSEMPAVVPGNPEASALLTRIQTADEDLRMPPTGKALPAEAVEALRAWIAGGAAWPLPPNVAENTTLPPLLDDGAFLRRVYLDTVGVPPTEEALRTFLADPSPYKRFRVIEGLLRDERVADAWMDFWLDMLAENPTLANPSLNSTGPFRWFLYDALRDNLPLDRLVTELILMRGDRNRGGSAGFALAAENDAPMAAKGHIIASAFLGVEMQCARCHDAPYHSATQRDLFSLAAMLDRKRVVTPESSTVPAAFFADLDRKPLIRVTLKPGEKIAPEWPFPQFVNPDDDVPLATLMQDTADTREKLAALITAPQNERFAQVIVNRIWKRYLGVGIVEPVHDWEGHEASHPELLTWLAREFIRHDYDVRHVMWLILTSDTYQRAAVGKNQDAEPRLRLFNGPERRRLSAEQVVDSLHAVTEVPMEADRLTFVHDGRQPVDNRQDLGQPHRAWMFASLSNERDRPGLSLPRAQAIVDVLQAFGWTGSRQKPITHRETDPNVLQPGILANGTLSIQLTRAADGSALAQLAVDATSPEALLESLFARILGRFPLAEESDAFLPVLEEGFEQRLLPAEEIVPPPVLPPLPRTTWFNNLNVEAGDIQIERARRLRQGPPGDRRLNAAWREAYEDVIWSLINHREFVWLP